jgi:hypothetical protein
MTTKEWLQAAYQKVGVRSWKPNNRAEVDKMIQMGYLRDTGHGGIALTEKGLDHVRSSS